MTLGELIRSHARGRTYSEIARAMEISGVSVSSQAVSNLAQRPLSRFPAPATIRALASALDVSESEVIRAASASLGLDIQGPTRTDEIHDAWLALTDRRTPEEIRALLRAAETIADQIRESQR